MVSVYDEICRKLCSSKSLEDLGGYFWNLFSMTLPADPFGNSPARMVWKRLYFGYWWSLEFFLQMLWSEEFYGSTATYRFLYLVALFVYFRMKFYIAWLVAEASCIACGLGVYPAVCKPKPGHGPTEPEKWVMVMVATQPVGPFSTIGYLKSSLKSCGAQKILIFNLTEHEQVRNPKLHCVMLGRRNSWSRWSLRVHIQYDISMPFLDFAGLSFESTEQSRKKNFFWVWSSMVTIWTAFDHTLVDASLLNFEVHSFFVLVCLLKKIIS